MWFLSNLEKCQFRKCWRSPLVQPRNSHSPSVPQSAILRRPLMWALAHFLRFWNTAQGAVRSQDRYINYIVELLAMWIKTLWLYLKSEIHAVCCILKFMVCTSNFLAQSDLRKWRKLGVMVLNRPGTFLERSRAEWHCCRFTVQTEYVETECKCGLHGPLFHFCGQKRMALRQKRDSFVVSHCVYACL